MDLFLNFLKKNKLLLLIMLAIGIGVSGGLIYSLNKYANLEIPQNKDTVIENVGSETTTSVYDKYVNNQTAIDKHNGKGENYNNKRSATSINNTIYGLNNFLFDCYQNIKVDEKIATTKSGKEVYALLNYSTAAELKEKLSEYVINDNEVLNEILTNYGFYIVKDKIGTLNEINASVLWINTNYENNILFSNDARAEVEVPLYQAGSIPMSAPVTQEVQPMTDSYGNPMGETSTQNKPNIIPNASTYPGQKVKVTLVKEHGNWKISSMEYNYNMEE